MRNPPIHTPSAPFKRCAIYTRKSTERGLDQDFNTLKAQQQICSAYIQSQQHKGWVETRTVYEDAAQSGRTLDRPAMKDLLSDIQRGRIDVVVVYKLDRLSRSLLDFVQLMDVFQRYGVSFVCITQNFDTADSLGRLVMNVLLTFAQFEREMTGDRIRDKRHAMTVKGLWSGGRPPLGYDLVDHRLVVNPEEAEIIRFVFEAYRRSGNLQAVARQCADKGYRSKTYMQGTGSLRVGAPIRHCSIRNILLNPVYVGLLHSGGNLYPGIQQGIVNPELWQCVADLHARQIAARGASFQKDVLDGLLYDCFGRSMTADRRLMAGKVYTYYRSNQNSWGIQNKVKRMGIRSVETEQLILSALQNFLCDRERLRTLLLDLGRHGPELARACRTGPIASRRLEALSRPRLRSVLHGLIARVEIGRDRIKVVARALEFENLIYWDFVGFFRCRTEDGFRSPTHLIDIPCAGAVRLERWLRLPITARKAQTYRINKRLRQLISEIQSAWELIENNRHMSPAELAKRANVSLSWFMKLIRLRYLAPDIVTAILDGAQPRELTRRTLIDADLPLDWALQRKLFGFPDQPPIRSTEATY